MWSDGKKEDYQSASFLDMFSRGSGDRVHIPPDMLCDLGNWHSISGLQGSLLKCSAHPKSKNGQRFLST